MTLSRDRGDIGSICDTGFGSSRRIDEMSEARLEPENAFRPVAISWSVAPRAKTSVRLSASRPSSCSGAM